jgi:hypothetical protein
MITKHIWTYWHQGWDRAPPLVTRCAQSWARRNPDYELHCLDQRSLFQHVDFPAGIDVRRRDLTVQKISALGRLALLSRYGGVWTDATVVCTRPLSEWLEEYYGSRFFAFRDPGPDRLLANWFMAAEADSPILRRLYRDLSDFYAGTHFWNQHTTLGDALLKRFLARWSASPEATVRWHSWFARKVLRVYPYFIFHYTFNRLILSDAQCAELWRRARPYPAEPPIRLQALARAADGIQRARAEIASGLVPMYKLDWRVETTSGYWAAVLQHLEERP